MKNRFRLQGSGFRLVCIFIFNFSFLIFNSVFSQSIQELEEKLKTASAEEKPGILNQLSEAYLKTSSDKAIDYAEQAMKAAKKAGDENEKAGALLHLGNAYSVQYNVGKAVQNYKDAIKIFDANNQPASSAYIWNKIGDAYSGSQQYSEAIDANSKALELLKKVNDKEGMISINIEIGDVYFKQKKYENALPYYQQALKLYESLKDIRGQAKILHKIGVTCNNWGSYDEGFIFLNRGYELAKKNNLNSIANEILPALEIAKKNQSEYEKNKSDFVQKKEKLTQEQIKTKELEINSLSAEKIKTMGEIEKLSSDAQLKELKIKTQQEEIIRKQMETESQTKANELLKKEGELKESELKAQKLVIWGAVGFSILVVILAFFVFLAYRNKKKANELLKQKNEIIYKQKEQIEQKNILITDSIDYAKNIQDAILPPAGMLSQHFPHSFILYKPKDIVSGDFYWMYEEKSNDNFYIAAADCTGHGVPGAFMSLLGFIMLDEIVRNVHVTPAEILKEVNTQLMDMLHQNIENTTGKFGMDIALIKYDKLSKEIIYAGAHNPLIIINNGQVNEVKADKISIGTTTSCSFTNNTVQAKEGDMIYLYSDGYQDQIGGEKRKKFLAFHLRELLQQIHALDPEKQKEALDKKHNEWRGATEQTDDILIIGLKV
ncbi:MAG: tetratricopeptide repeat protein [Bacteroidetes bacterium]|nr:tetratricopeptide repeat protein [Bacteroidota bacterium]